ncbi:MAG: ABC transporter permease [Lentisphaeria bacterium]|nr:ABC transporter permease [Lentisphaeria bacterium]
MKNIFAKLGMILPFLGLIFVFLIFTGLIAAFEPDSLSRFLSMRNMQTVLMQTTIVGIGALGMTFVIISGGIDLSVGSIIALATVVTASVMNLGALGTYGNDWAVSGFWVFIGCISAIVAAALCGLVTGVISTKGKIVPFIVTLGMMQVVRGIAKWIGKNEMVRTPDNALQTFMDPVHTTLFFAPGVYILLFLTISTFLVLKYTVFGRYTYAIGSSENTARLCGIAVSRYRIIIYTLCGAFTGVAGVMQYATLGSGSPTEAVGLELDIIAAVVIGGGSLDGGEGSALGTIIGALMLQVLRSGCVMLGVPSYIQEIILGSIIVAAAAIDRLKHKKAKK